MGYGAELVIGQRFARTRWRLTHPAKSVDALPLPRLQHRLGRNPRPGRNLIAESNIGRMHLGRSGTLAGKIGEHVLGLRSRGVDKIGRETPQLYIVLCRERSESLDIEPLHFGKCLGGLSGAGMRHHRLQLAVERLPGFERDNALTRAVRLVETRVVVERRVTIEPERDIGARPDEFRALDQAG